MEDGGKLGIVHCLRAPVGGVFRHVRDLIAAQSAAGHAVGLVCDATTGGAHETALLAGLERDLALGLHRIPMARSIGPGDLLAAYRIARRLAPLRADVLHGHGAKGGTYARLVGSLLRADGQRVARFYSPHGGSLHFDKASLEGRVYFGVERLLERMTDGIVFVSRFEERAYADKIGVPRCTAALVYNGVSEAEYEPVGSDADATDLLCVGEMRHLKGTDVFVRAVIDMARGGSGVTATLVGPGTKRPAYEAMVAEAGLADRIRFHDSMPIRAALRRGRVVVVPSRAESLPYVVLETIAAGKPLVATRVGGIPEIFADRSAALVEPGSVPAMVDALGAALADPAATAAAAEALREAIRPVFSVGPMARQIEALYAAAVRRPRPGPAPRPAEAGVARPGS